MANTSTTELDLLKTVTTSGGATDTLNVVGTVTATPSGVQHVIVDSGAITLPSGAATSANQSTEIASLASIDGKITAVNTGAVVVSSSALPSGASTAARQDTGNTSLSSIDTKLTSQATATKQDTGNTSIASVDTKMSTLLTQTDGIEASLTSIDGKIPASPATTGKQDTGNTSLSSIDGKLAVLGQHASSGSSSVVLSSDHGVIPLTADRLVTGTLGAVTSLTFDTTGLGSIILQLGGTQNTPSFGGSVDGVTYFGIAGNDLVILDGQVPSSMTSSNWNHPFQFNTAGLRSFRISQGGSLINTTYAICGSQNSGVISQVQAVFFAAQSGTWTVTSTGEVAQASTTSGQVGELTQGAVTTNAPVYVTAKTNPLSLDTAGNLRVSLKDTPANTNKLLVTADIAAAQTLANVTTLGTITNVVHVDDNASSLTVDNAGTFAVQATIPVTSIAKAEDSVFADGDIGVPALAVRRALPTNTTNTDGDYEVLSVSQGKLLTTSTIDADGGDTVVSLLKTLINEVRGLRLATVALATNNTGAKEADFDPNVSPDYYQ